jgi:hypothetical protein
MQRSVYLKKKERRKGGEAGGLCMNGEISVKISTTRFAPKKRGNAVPECVLGT